MMKRIYFGHPVNTYDTELEKFLLQKISASFPGREIENPNQERHNEGYKRWKRDTGNGMDYYNMEVLPTCDGGIFLPFRDGAWSAGVFAEAEFFYKRRAPIWRISTDGQLLPMDTHDYQPLTIKETIARIRTPEGEIISY